MEQRLRARGTDSEEAIQMRISKAAIELEDAPLFDVVLVNDKLEDSFAKADKLVEDFIGIKNDR